MENVIKLAEEMSKAFETVEKHGGIKIVVLKMGSPQWMTDVVQAAHSDRFPDDDVYTRVEDCIATISEMDNDSSEDDIRERFYFDCMAQC